MVLIILATLLVLGIAFFQAVQGLFSALITAVLTILCAAVAFQYYEPLAAMLYSRQPAHADAGALIALFVIPLLGLRLLFDRFLPGNVLVGAWPDRIAGGALGLITGMIITGVLTLAIQMLPTGPRWLTYRPFDDSLQPEQTLAPFYPDEFTLGLVDVLSGGSLGVGKPLRQDHDNFRLEYWCARNRIEQTRKVEEEPRKEYIGRLDAKTDSLTVLACFEPNDPSWERDPNFAPRDPLIEEGEPSRILVVRVGVDQSARDQPDNWWRLPATHFRLAARKSKDDPALVSHYPVAYLTAFESNVNFNNVVTTGTGVKWKAFAAPVDGNVPRDQRRALVGRLGVERQWRSEGGPDKLVIDWVFRVGRQEVPEFLAFRRVARQSVPAAKLGMPPAKDALDRIIGRG